MGSPDSLLNDVGLSYGSGQGGALTFMAILDSPIMVALLHPLHQLATFDTSVLFLNLFEAWGKA